ncbi:hypothetical protein NPIL_46551 [Nephila pilipes]|uniref:Uncharacterized protein n=1 Tax=Nephila pilipes TaxID=299642 RepID=A0A8X6QQJ1_NEPPI|nr:hypothetical protein NPIL_46551 [Nephila pilipes]
MPSLEMEISIETPNQNLPLDDNIKKCQNVQFYIEAYTETIQKITEVEAIIKKAQLLPFLYGPQDHELHKEEMARWMEELKKTEDQIPLMLKLLTPNPTNRGRHSTGNQSKQHPHQEERIFLKIRTKTNNLNLQMTSLSLMPLKNSKISFNYSQDLWEPASK